MVNKAMRDWGITLGDRVWSRLLPKSWLDVNPRGYWRCLKVDGAGSGDFG